MSYFTVRGTVVTGQAALDHGITDLMVTTALDGSRMLYTTSGPTGGVGAFALEGVTPSLADFTLFDTEWADGALHELTLIETADGAELLVAGNGEDQLTALTLSGDGAILGQAQYTGLDATTAQILDIEQWDDETLVLSNTGTHSIQVYAMAADGGLTQLVHIEDTDTTYAADVFKLDTVEHAGTSFLISASQSEHGVTAFRMVADGVEATDSVGVAEGLGIMVPTGMEVVTLGGRSFVIVASAPGDGQGQSGAISVLELAADGSLTPTDHVLDTLHTRFGMVNSLEVIESDGHVYVLAGGGDDGLTLFALLPNGRLQLLDVISDTYDIGLQNVTAMAAAVDGDTLEIFVASQSEAGVTELAVDLSMQGAQLIAKDRGGALAGTAQDDILLGGAGNDTLVGGAGRDLIEDGGGRDTLTGGAGMDTFILRADGDHDVISDFQFGVDRIDLSAWPMLYDAGQLSISATRTGAVVEWRGETLEIITSNGASLSAIQVQASILASADRIPGFDDLFGGLGDPPPPEPPPNDAGFDFNGDGVSDVLWRNPVTGQMGLYLMDEAASQTWKGLGGSNPAWDVIGTGDFDGDGVTDILWRNPVTGQMGLYLMDEAASQTWKSLGGSNPAWDIVGTGDFDGDGTDDILWRNLDTGQMGLYMMEDASQTWQGLGGSNPAWDIVGTGDFDGDGTDDILWRNLDTGQMGLYLMDETASQTWKNLGSSNPAWNIVGTGDFNGDGVNDILWRDLTTGQMGLDLMDGNADKTWASLGGSNTSWNVAGTGDFNGDGVDDILWRNLTTGQMGLYLMDETGARSWAGLGGSNTSWSVDGYFDDFIF